MFSSLHSARNHEEGFTLVELLIAIFIIGLLAAIAIPLYLHALSASKIVRLKADVTSSALSLGTYYDRFGKYPDATTFASTIAVIATGSNEQMTFNNPNNQPQGNGYDSDVCVTGSLTQNGTTSTFSYNLQQKKLVTGACTYVMGTLPVENPS